jgi:hypothetical protein
MSSRLGKAFRGSALFHWYKRISAPTEHLLWRLKGSPGPKVPHLVKQRVIQQYAREFNFPVLVETGTNYAHMIYAQKDRFREIYSIELDVWKAESARRKFAGRPSLELRAAWFIESTVCCASAACVFLLILAERR